ncbi:MAG: class I tRNA ligase family protein [Thermoplasmata archaeon]
MDRAREERWQLAWQQAGLATARRVPGREKFYALVAYPGSSGFLHVGHLRGLAYADALHRFYRMRGRQVFFPTGTHATGLPSVTFAQKVADRDPSIVAQLQLNGVPESEWPSLEDPATAARFLGRNYLGVFRALGLLLDESAYVTTIDEDYQAFIRWQFARLDRAGALVQAPYFASVCPVCGPVSVDPSETDLARGGEAEWIEYTVVPFRLADGRILLTGTLRPETVFGVTNLWVHPSEALVVWHQGDHEYVVSPAGAALLVEQHGGKVGHDVPIEHVLGQLVEVPLTHTKVPVLASPIVDPAVGTGVVMSVPAHAPADWLALAELAPGIRSQVGTPPTIVTVEPTELSPSEKELLKGEGLPAERAVRATHAQSLKDIEALDRATERLYRVEHARGRMTVAPFDGVTVTEARPQTAHRLQEVGGGFVLNQFSEPVICRNGHTVIIRRVPDQWFLHYADPAWKAKTVDLIGRVKVDPPEYAAELPDILEWFRDRPCTRKGRWLGTPFPRDPDWLIEPIADSTFYPAYFIVRRFVSSGQVALDSLTPAFFDYVFLGEGPGEPSVARALLEEIREEFTYWYPLDLNIGGKEHKRVHFPVFLYTHALLLPPALQPKGLFVYWWLTAQGGAKISKKDIGSKGGVPPIHEAFEQYGADALRLFSAFAASPFQDIEWDPLLVAQAADRLTEVDRVARDALGTGEGASPELDAWLRDEVRTLVERSIENIEQMDFRQFAQTVYVEFPARLRRYIARGGSGGAATTEAGLIWVRLLSPLTPHLAEELGQAHFRGLVAEQPFPRVEELPANSLARYSESYLERIETDLRSVIKSTEARGQTAAEVLFYVAAPWKRTLELWLRESGPDAPPDLPRRLHERAREHPELAAYASQVPEYVKRVQPQFRSDPPAPPENFDEAGFLRGAAGFLARRFAFGQVSVLAEAEAAPHDPKNRRQRARPGRPAFYLVERPSGASTARPKTP